MQSDFMKKKNIRVWAKEFNYFLINFILHFINKKKHKPVALLYVSI